MTVIPKVVLPFATGEAKPPPPVAHQLPARASDNLDGTITADDRSDSSTLPFTNMSPVRHLVVPKGPNPRAAAPLPELTIEQFASLCAELRAARPDQIEAIARRYGLPDGAAHRSLDASWQPRFAADTELRQRFDQLVAHYSAWLAAQAR